MDLRDFFKGHWKEIVLLIFAYFVIDYLLDVNIEAFTTNVEEISIKERKSSFEKLMEDFDTIFPDRNRNSGGSQYFKHIVDMGLSKKEFELYNSFYCGVSGSPVDPERKNNNEDIIVKDINGNDI